MKHDKVIGILGGMGAASTAHAFQLLVNYQQDILGCVQDEDFYKTVIYSIALKDWDETGFVNQESVKNQLVEEIRKLEAFGVDIIAIPCNTVHYFYREMQAAVRTEIINMVEETAHKVIKNGRRKIGIVSSRSTRDLKLYEKFLNRFSDVTVLSCDDEQQEEVDRVILNVQAGRDMEESKHRLLGIISEMRSKGADAIIAGCTELSIPLVDADFPLFDSSRILVQKIFENI